MCVVLCVFLVSQPPHAPQRLQYAQEQGNTITHVYQYHIHKTPSS